MRQSRSRRVLLTFVLASGLMIGCTPSPAGPGNTEKVGDVGGQLQPQDLSLHDVIKDLRATLKTVSALKGVEAPSGPPSSYRLMSAFSLLTVMPGAWSEPEPFEGGEKRTRRLQYTYDGVETDVESELYEWPQDSGKVKYKRIDRVLKSPYQALGTYVMEGISSFPRSGTPSNAEIASLDQTTTFTSPGAQSGTTLTLHMETDGNSMTVHVKGDLNGGGAIDLTSKNTISGDFLTGSTTLMTMDGWLSSAKGQKTTLAYEMSSTMSQQGFSSKGFLQFGLMKDYRVRLDVEGGASSTVFVGSATNDAGQAIAELKVGPQPEDHSQVPSATLTFPGKEPQEFSLEFMKDMINVATKTLFETSYTL